MPGPIAPIDHFGTSERDILNRYVREGLIPSMVLDGVAYVSYYDVYGDLLSDHFHGDSDSPAAWDGTYAMFWSPPKRITGSWLKPRGFKDAVRCDMFQRISLQREFYFPPGRDGHLHARMAAYPRHVANRAAEMYQELHRQDGFVERFRQCTFVKDAVNMSAFLSRFNDYEADLLRMFMVEGWIRPYEGESITCFAESELLYYNLFAAKIIESELDLDPNMPNRIVVMLDGTFTYGETQRPRTIVHRKQAAHADR